MTNLSIITVCKNSEATISNTLESIICLKKNEVDLNHIIIDGLSTDNTLNIINSYRERYASLHINLILISEEDKGIYDAMNKGILLSKSEWTAFLNSDDRVPSNLKFTPSDFENADIIYGNIDFVKNNEIYRRRPKGHQNLFDDMTIYHPMTLVKCDIYRRVGLYDTDFKLASDYDFFIRCKLSGIRFKYINRTFAIYSTEGSTNKNLIKSWVEVTKIQKLHKISNYRIYTNFFIKIIKRLVLTVIRYIKC